MLGGLVLFTIANAVLRLWGNWYVFFIVTFVQALFIVWGIYPYLFDKKMLVFGGGDDLEYHPGTENVKSRWLRRLAMFGYMVCYLGSLLAS